MVTLSVSDAKENWAALLRLVYQQGLEVAIERRGEPIAVVLSFADFVELDRTVWEVRTQQREEAYRTMNKESGMSLSAPDSTDSNRP